MAGFEKGKTKNRRFWDATVYGSVLSVREWGTFDDRLRGYRAMSTAQAAKAEMARLASEKVSEGFVPVDAEAKALAATLPAPKPAKKGAVTFPVRQDVFVYNEGTGFLVTSGKLAGKGYENGGKNWQKSVAAGDLFPVALYQDDSFLIRVVAGDELSAQEEEEWVGRVDARLKVRDGRLVVSAVAEFVEEGYEPEGHTDEFVRMIDIPKGEYSATMYTYLPGVNGAPCLDSLAGGYEKKERIGTWMRRTRPGVEFPAWMRRWCIAYPADDPGHETDWKGLEHPDDDSAPDFIHFLLHLRPTDGATKGVPPTGLNEGWFSETGGARKPERCPLGLEAANVIGYIKEESTDLLYAQDITDSVRGFPSKPLSSPVEVEVARLGEVFGVAWLAHPRCLPSLRATLPKGSTYRFLGAWPEELVVFQDGNVLHALPTSGSGAGSRSALMALGPMLKDLPGGTVIEMLTAPIEGGQPKEGDGGLQRYSGKVASGVWTIDATFPAVPADRFRRALELAAELNARDTIKVSDEIEAKAILKWLRANHGPYVIEDNPPRLHDGEIQLKKPERGLLWLVGSAAFAIRFRDVFPVMDLSDDEDDDNDGNNDNEANDALPYEERASKPIQGARLLDGANGRVYFQSMALMVSEKLAAIIQKREKELFSLKFRHVGDLVCSAFPTMVVRAYAKTDGDTWATYLVAAPDVVKFELSTRFEKNLASLATLESPGVDEPAKASFRQSMPTASAAAMLEAHDLRKIELSAEFGPPIKLASNMRGLAESVEAALAKQSPSV